LLRFAEGTTTATPASGHREVPWHPPASLQKHGLRWMFMPITMLWIPGVVGWAIGRCIARMLRY
jgi:hypothetical protein